MYINLFKFLMLEEKVVIEYLITPVVFNALVFLASLVLLFYSADLLIDGISSYAEKLGLSDEIIGFLVVAAAASMPEVVASLGGLAAKEAGFLFGTILGTNMVHMGLLIGALTVMGRKMNLECKLLRHSKLLVWALLLLPFILASDGELSRPDGLVLVLAFGVYVVNLWRKEQRFMRLKNVRLRHVWRDTLVFVGALVAMILAGRYLVFSGIVLSRAMEIPPYFIALTVIAIGSAVPDFAVGLRAIVKGKQQIGIGDIMGSTVIELLLFIGLVAIVQPLPVQIATVASTAFILLASLTTTLYFIELKTITWRHGVVLLALYVLFLGTEIYKVLPK